MVSFDGSPSSRAVEYEPVGVKDLLVAMKDSSELIVDLAYSALLNNSEELAEEVLELEAEMDVLQIQARMNLLMAARNPDDAKRLAPVLAIVSAAEKISNAAGDVAQVVFDEEELPGAIRATLPEAVEVLTRAEVDEESPYEGQMLGVIDLETETGVRVIALRGNGEWNLNPDAETRLDAGDILLLRGSEASVGDVYEDITGETYDRPAEPDHDITDLTRAVDTIVLMKNMSEVSVDLAYGSVLFDDEQLAQEVRSLEVEVDALQARLEAWTMQAAREIDEPVALRGLIRLANSTEAISDAALEITEGILRDIDTHPVIAESVRESDVAIRRVAIEDGSTFDGRTVAQLLDSHPGTSIVAIHRKTDEWLLQPEEAEQLDAGDVVIARGTWKATETLLTDASV